MAITEPMLVRETQRIINAIESKSQSASGRRQKDETDRFTRATTFASRQVMNFADALLPIPHSLGQLVRMSVGAASPGAMSTLQKSWQLVMIQIGRVFIPAILYASKALQDFAGTLKRWSKEPITGKEMSELGQLAKEGDVAGVFSKYGDMIGKGLMQGILGPEGIFTGAEKKYGGFDVAEARAGDVGLGVGGGGGASMARVLKGVTEDMRQNLLGSMARMGGVFQNAAMLMSRTDRAAGRGPGPEARSLLQSLMVSAQQKGGGGGMLTDLRPPGYAAEYQGFEEAAQKLQMDALNTSNIELKVQQDQLEVFKETLAFWQKTFGNPTVLPPQKNS